MTTSPAPGTGARVTDETLVADVAGALYRILVNYEREGSGPGSRFEEQTVEAVQAKWAVQHVREAIESAPWLLDLVHAAETAGTELGCNGDHEANEGCDGCAWEALANAVPARVRNAADERASKP